jgi:hypothetical protein
LFWIAVRAYAWSVNTAVLRTRDKTMMGRRLIESSLGERLVWWPGNVVVV